MLLLLKKCSSTVALDCRNGPRRGSRWPNFDYFCLFTFVVEQRHVVAAGVYATDIDRPVGHANFLAHFRFLAFFENGGSRREGRRKGRRHAPMEALETALAD